MKLAIENGDALNPNAQHEIWSPYDSAATAREMQALLESKKKSVQNNLTVKVRTLHERLMEGEFSQGYMAKQLGISRLDLIHLLEAMGLSVTNV